MHLRRSNSYRIRLKDYCVCSEHANTVVTKDDLFCHVIYLFFLFHFSIKICIRFSSDWNFSTMCRILSRSITLLPSARWCVFLEREFPHPQRRQSFYSLETLDSSLCYRVEQRDSRECAYLLLAGTEVGQHLLGCWRWPCSYRSVAGKCDRFSATFAVQCSTHQSINQSINQSIGNITI